MKSVSDMGEKSYNGAKCFPKGKRQIQSYPEKLVIPASSPS